MMIHKKGIFVFESKNYSGWIFGNETQKTWTQVLPAGKGHNHKESFYNPILQNQSHIRHLKTFLGEAIEMKSIIVFSERCTLKNIQVKNNDIYVIKRNNITQVINAINNSIQEDILSDNDIYKIYNRLYPFTQVDAMTKEQHINNIKKTQAQAKPANENTCNKKIVKTEMSITSEPGILTCPRCSGKLLLRTATKGVNAGRQFYGCSNYPKCKFTKQKTEPIETPCPKCGSQVLTRHGRGGRTVFYSCEHYPECDFSSWDAPTAEKCPNCGKMLFRKKGKSKLSFAVQFAGFVGIGLTVGLYCLFAGNLLMSLN